MHGCEGEIVCKLTNTMIPYFNAGIFLENKSKIGKVEEVFGPVNKVYFTIKVNLFKINFFYKYFLIIRVKYKSK